MFNSTYESYKAALSSSSYPIAFIDHKIFESNIEALIKSAESKSIRLATKSIRCLTILKKIMDYSPKVNGLMSYSLKESLWLLENGFTNILIGYPCFNKIELEEFCQHESAYQHITLMVDSVDHLALLDLLAKKYDKPIRICLDIDMSIYPFFLIYFGVHRSPIKHLYQFKKIINQILHKYESLKLVGLMGYEAQNAGVGDFSYSGIKGKIVRFLKRMSQKKVAAKRLRSLKYIKHKNIKLEFFNGGGTGSVHTTSLDDTVTEITIGSGFYAPSLFDSFEKLPCKPSLFFATQVVRKPSPKIATCFSGGYIASGETSLSKNPIPILPLGLKIFKNEMFGEVQTPLKMKNRNDLHIGDPVIFRPAKAGEILERFNSIALIENNSIIEYVPTYRGEGQNFG